MIEILNGNELIVQGGLEAGFSLYTGYPGSPLADFFNILYQRRDELKQKGIKVVIANSEANAAAMASGAKQAGRDVLVGMKSMGLHVAADALSVGNFANPGKPFLDIDSGETVAPGVVITVGDDPWSLSTSTPADSRYLFKHLHIPFLEPSTPQELKDWLKTALYISRRTSVYQGLLLTTYMAEGGGRVETFPEKEVSGELVNLDPSEFDLSKLVMVPPNSHKADISMINDRFPKVFEIYKKLNLDQKFGNEVSDIGFISSGVIFETLKQVLEEGEYLSHFSLYKLASSFPLVDEVLIPYIKGLKKLVVVEEKRGFLETELREFCQRNNLEVEIFGKTFADVEGFPAHGGLNFEIINEKLQQLWKLLKLDPCRDLKTQLTAWDQVLPRRLPTFCPGCPHRETLSLLKDLRSYLKKSGIDLISHGDVGCYSLSFLPPFREMHNLSAMGQGGALGAGVDLFTENPSVVLMGDSTFYHSGMTDISNSVQLGHSITYIVLDNDNTAMTGHQVSPSSGVSVDGITRPRQDILKVAKGLGVSDITEVNPSDRYFYQNLLREKILLKGVKVIVSNKECALTFHGRKKAEDRKLLSKGITLPTKSFYQINSAVCEDCRECVESTGCPGLTQVFDAYGSKLAIDPQICVGDSYCTKLKVCPSFERVEVSNFHPTKYQKKKDIEDLVSLPEPVLTHSFESILSGNDLRVVVTGVGGSGVTTISRILAKAAVEMDGRTDLDFKFVDQKGLAQRNGNVTAHLAIYKKGKSYGAVTPKGTASLLLSPDILDAALQLDFLAIDGLGIFDRSFQIPLSILLDKGEEKEPLRENELETELVKKLGEKVVFGSFKDIAHHHLGRSVYASAMILGAAYQSGRLPFSLDSLKNAFETTMRGDEIETNWRAFRLGRELFHNPQKELVGEKTQSENTGLYLKSLKESYLFSGSSRKGISSFNLAFEKLNQIFKSSRSEHLAQILHDILVYDRGRLLGNFLEEAEKISTLYAKQEWQELALGILARTYFIKDEIMVSHLMISPLHEKTNLETYSGLGTAYKVCPINRPSFDIFGIKLEFNISPNRWMLKCMRHFRILRRLLPSWHKIEREIAISIREEIVKGPQYENFTQERSRLMKLCNIKGYREVRFKNAENALL